MIIPNMFKKKNNTKRDTNKNEKLNSFGEPLNHLIDGELPWGWISANKEFIDKTQSEYKYFLNEWNDSINKSPKNKYSALKSLLSYINDIQTRCNSLGECFAYWCNNCLLTDTLTAKLESTNNDLSENLLELQKEYEKKQHLLQNLEENLYVFINSNNGILQKDIYSHFGPEIKNNIADILYQWEKEKKINRIKSGNTYIITVNNY